MRELGRMGVPPGFSNRDNVNAVVTEELVEVSYFVWRVQTPDVDGGEGNGVI